MLGRRRPWLVTVKVGLAVYVLRHSVPCLCLSSCVSRGGGSNSDVSNRSSSNARTGFVSPSTAGRDVRPAAASARSTSASARQWLPRGRKSLAGTVERGGPWQKHVLRGISRDHDDGYAAAAGGLPEGKRGGEICDPDVNSLVDLVNLLHSSDNPLWELVRFEGREASKQSHVSSMIHDSVLARTSLEDAVSYDVANKMATTFLSPTEVQCLLTDMYADEPFLDFVVAEDLLAHAMQDISLPDVLTAMLYHKGFTALTTYRLMHWLWRNDRHNLARYLQSICSEVCAADIHPAARIGKGILMASGCDIVIGETAVVGDGVCLLQGVTLGGTGNQTGDRHPKVGKGCHIGAGSSILGNIPLGEGSRIEAASVVVKPTKPYTINRGVPSQTVGWIVCDPHQDVGASVEEGAEGEAGVPGGARRPRRLFSNYGSLYMGV